MTNAGLATAALFVIGCVASHAADSKVCAGCHASIFRNYMASPMATTSGAAGSSSPVESLQNSSFAGRSGDATYQVARTAGVLSFSFSSDGVRGRRTLDYFVGSAITGRSYLTAIDGFLFQAPVSYYSKPAAWGLSPGYETGDTIDLMREVKPACLNCHASGLRLIPGTANGYAEPPYREAGVACERCHGPGEDHIAKVKSGKNSGQPGIVNPAKLDPRRRDSVCAQCHLPGAVEISKSASSRSYLPGDLLSDSVSVFVWAGSNRETTVNGHFEQLARSVCSRSSGDKLWCGTCHNPHARSPDYRDKCLGCHAISSCKAGPKTRAEAADQCTSCHMPRIPAQTVQHAALTDHSIRKFPGFETTPRIGASAQLVAFGGFPAGDRELGLAYATVAIRDANRVWGRRAFDLLRTTAARLPDDVEVASMLAALYERMGNEPEACALYARIAVASNSAPETAVNYGTCLAKQGKLDEAMRLWSRVLTRNPGTEAARLNLAVAQIQTGLVDQARANLNAALRFDPVSKRARQLLVEIEKAPPK